MAKSQDAKKTAKKEPLKTAKEKKEEKRDKKNSPKRDWFLIKKGCQVLLTAFFVFKKIIYLE